MAGGMKRLAKETAIYGLSSIVGRFLNWMLVPMYTRVLANTNEFGVVTNLYGWTALLLVILTYGMETGFFRFVNKQEEREPMRVYATALYSVGFTSAHRRAAGYQWSQVGWADPWVWFSGQAYPSPRGRRRKAPCRAPPWGPSHVLR